MYICVISVQKELAAIPSVAKRLPAIAVALFPKRALRAADTGPFELERTHKILIGQSTASHDGLTLLVFQCYSTISY